MKLALITAAQNRNPKTITTSEYIDKLRGYFLKDDDYIFREIRRIESINPSDQASAMVEHVNTLEALQRYHSLNTEGEYSPFYYEQIICR